MDTDGYESKIIRGALEVINRFKPLILLELCPTALEGLGDDIIDLVSMLSNLGYEFYLDKGLLKFPSTDAVIKSIPKASAINVLLSVSDSLPEDGGA